MRHRYAAAALALAATAATVAFLYAGDPPADVRGARPAASVPSAAPAAATVAAPTAADLDFARGMAAHHEQAVLMSRSLLAKPGTPERIRAIADFIAHDQQREITEMNGWLAAWAQTGGHDHGAGPKHGMLTAAQLRELDDAPAGRAGPIFLRLMIEHHRGAITMARTLLDGDGRNVYTHNLARHVINEQTDENRAMAKLL